MSADPAAREKWSAYPNTILTFDGPSPLRVDLRQHVSDDQRRSLAAGGWATPFAVMTAENPSGEHTEDTPTPESEAAKERGNRGRRAALRDELHARHVRVRDVVASAPEGSYSEHCVAIVVPLAEATALAREYEQLAIFWFDGSSFWLVPAALEARPIALPGVAGAG